MDHLNSFFAVALFLAAIFAPLFFDFSSDKSAQSDSAEADAQQAKNAIAA